MHTCNVTTGPSQECTPCSVTAGLLPGVQLILIAKYTALIACGLFKEVVLMDAVSPAYTVTPGLYSILGVFELVGKNLVGRKALNLTNQIVEYTSYLLTSNCGPQNTTVGESLPKMAWSLGSQQIGSDNWLTPHLVDQDLPHK